MKRVICAVLALAVAGCSGDGPAVKAADGRSFEFREMTALRTTLGEAREMGLFSSCETDPADGSSMCSFARADLAGVEVTQARAQFVDDKFDYLDVALPRYNYQPMRDALLKIYGKPCNDEAAVGKQRREAGKIIRGREVQWCFDNGFLALMEGARHGSDDESELEFLSSREPADAPSYNSITL